MVSGGAIGGAVAADLRDFAPGLAGVRALPLPSGGGQQVGSCREGSAGGVVQHTQVLYPCH